MPMSILSIAIPTYNMERWLPAAIESCLWQTHRDIEILVINDGSTDKSGEIADRYARLDSRVRHVRQFNQGLGKARQKGQDEAHGDFITWLDADDFLSPVFAERMLAQAEQDQVDMVCANAIVFSDRTCNTRRYFPHPAASRLSFDSSPEYWKSKVVWRWSFSLPFLRTGKNGGPFAHPSFRLGQDVCIMYDTLTRVDAFSQCADSLYFFRQEHKSAHASLETEIEHELAHFNAVKEILLPAGKVKPFVKYLNENYWRDIKNIAPRMTGPDSRWRERALQLGRELFQETSPEWFEGSFLAPELKPNRDLVPLASALRNGNMETAHAILERLSRRPSHAIDKGNAFHTIRRTVKAFFSPTSRRTRTFLRELRKRAERR